MSGRPNVQWKCTDHRGGFQSGVPTSDPSCNPGDTPRGCSNARQFSISVGAGATITVDYDPYQGLVPTAIVGLPSQATENANITVDDLQAKGSSLFQKLKDVSGAAVDGLGVLSDLTPELIRSYLNPFPTAPVVNETKPLQITLTNTDGVAAHVAKFWVWAANPAGK